MIVLIFFCKKNYLADLYDWVIQDEKLASATIKKNSMKSSAKI